VRNFSEDGSRLFFQSYDALVPHDSNGRKDVYEYRDRNVHLLSNGAGNFASEYLDASSTGNDVFIATADQLVPADQDTRVDVYDVRVGGGFPVSVPAAACDNSDSCKPPTSQQPSVFGAPASATFSGAGNIVPSPSALVKPKPKAKPARCMKRFVKKHNRCVKKKRRKKAHKASDGRRRSHDEF
jgi:hypothetical protein